MNDKAKKQYALKEGKVYLRDTRNGRIYQYEDTLAQMGYIERFVAGKEQPKVHQSGMVTQMSSAEKAAEFDRLAAMTNEEREAELAKRNIAKAVDKDAEAVQTAASMEQMTSGQTAKGDAQRHEEQQKAQAQAQAQTQEAKPAAPPAPPRPPQAQGKGPQGK